MKMVLAILTLSLFVTLPMDADAQTRQFYLKKASLECIAENRSAYEQAGAYDFTVVYPQLCPEAPKLDDNVSNEYLNLKKPDEVEDPLAEPSAVVVLLQDLDCLERLSNASKNIDGDALLRIDLDACAVSP